MRRASPHCTELVVALALLLLPGCRYGVDQAKLAVRIGTSLGARTDIGGTAALDVHVTPGRWAVDDVSNPQWVEFGYAQIWPCDGDRVHQVDVTEFVDDIDFGMPLCGALGWSAHWQEGSHRRGTGPSAGFGMFSNAGVFRWYQMWSAYCWAGQDEDEEFEVGIEVRLAIGAACVF